MICNYCQREFEPRHFNQRLCSPECKDAAIKRAKAKYKTTGGGIASNERWVRSEHRKENEKRYRDNPRRKAMNVDAQWKYINTNPDAKAKKRIRDHNRRCSQGSFTAEEWTRKLQEYGGKCAHCGATDHLTIDHIVPLARGGANTIDNIQPLCAFCNSSKGARYVG